MKIVDGARAIQEAGCIGFEIEAVPAPVAAAVDAAVDIFIFGIAVDALKRYAAEVHGGQFPDAEHSYTMKPEEAEKLLRLLGKK